MHEKKIDLQMPFLIGVVSPNLQIRQTVMALHDKTKINVHYHSFNYYFCVWPLFVNANAIHKRIGAEINKIINGRNLEKFNTYKHSLCHS